MISRRNAIIGGSTCLIALVVLAFVGIVIHETRRSNEPTVPDSISNANGINLSKKAIRDLCKDAYYQKTCINSLTTATNSSNPRTLIKVTFQRAIQQLKDAVNQTIHMASKDPKTAYAYKTCQGYLDDSIDDLQRTFERLQTFQIANLKVFIDDIMAWLTGALTYQESCLELFEKADYKARAKMRDLLENSREITINSLALVKAFSRAMSIAGLQDSKNNNNNNTNKNRRLIGSSSNHEVHWVLKATPTTITPNVTVAKDGTGNYTTINEALSQVLPKSDQRFTIYIKKGVYQEYIRVNKTFWNVAFIGDGPTETMISGNKSFMGGFNTSLTPTVLVEGDNFIAKDLGFENTAGAIMEQAVALRVTADKAIFHNCQMDGYQDTLYAHNHRQYYRDCTISGTIDFIFGNAAALFENCTLVVRKPEENQKCMVTAQGRTNANETSGIVLKDCQIKAAPEYPLTNTLDAFLGRPWRPESRTIIMNSYVDGIINPAGWSTWNNTDAHISTCYYAEVGNRGPGANLSGRVTWPGIKNISLEEASSQYNAKQFLDINMWNAGDFFPVF